MWFMSLEQLQELFVIKQQNVSAEEFDEFVDCFWECLSSCLV